jgi:iron complex transport system substrate-binding protein
MFLKNSGMIVVAWAVLGMLPGTVAGTVQAQPVQVTDARGVEIRLAQPAQRIITLAPHLTELVYAAAAGNRLAGVARFSNHPPEARLLPVVSDAAQFDIEQMLALKPDLVLAWHGGTPPEMVSRIERIGVPVYVSGAARLADIAVTMEAVATLAGTLPASAGARAGLAADLRALVSRRYAGPPVRVFYEIWPRPLMTVSNAHVISEIIGLCGGVNIFGALPSLTPEVSREALLAARPEVVLGGSSADTMQQFAARWAGLPPPLDSLPAYRISPDLIQRPTPRLLEGARLVCAHLETVRAARR